MKKNLLVTLADRNYIQQAKQLFSSVYWNAGWKGDYMLLAHEIPEKELKWFRDKGILVRKCKPISNKGWRYWPPTLLNKFYLFTPEFKKWKKIIYLDADIIVKASLDRLTKVKSFGAVKMRGITTLQKLIETYPKSKEILDILQKEAYKLKSPAFVAGVMVFDTNITDKNAFIELKQIFEHKKFSGSEEIVLNLYFYKKWKRLSLVYNVSPNHMRNSFNILKYKDKAIILHFARFDNLPEERPWNPVNPFYEEWKSNLERAELIDLKNIPEGIKWSKLQIYWNSLYLWIKRYIPAPSYRFKKISFYIINTPDKIIGKFGIFMKKHNPKLYHKLKKIKDGK